MNEGHGSFSYGDFKARAAGCCMGAPDLLNPERRMLRAMQLSEASRSWDLEGILAACDWSTKRWPLAQVTVCRTTAWLRSLRKRSEKFVWTLRANKPLKMDCSKRDLGLDASGRGRHHARSSGKL